MTIPRFLSLVIAFLFTLNTARGWAQKVTAAVYRTVEIVLQSGRTYAQPVLDVSLSCTWTSPQGRSIVVRGFWDGGTTYRVRFMPDVPGLWEWETVCSDTANIGLHGRNGIVEVTAAIGDTPFTLHGPPRISPDNRSLVHADGTPFFYIADTAWELAWKATMEELRAYLSDRKRKGFNAVQFCAISHQGNGRRGMMNQEQETTFIDDGLSLPNPGYFRFLDSAVRLMNEAGMTAAIVPVWAWVAEPHHDDPRYAARFFSESEAVNWASYLAARYAGSNVIWIVGGDKPILTDTQKRYWTNVGRALRAADGGRHLVTVHPCGGSASYLYFDGSADWLDFHMYQSSHALHNDAPSSFAIIGWSIPDPKPLLDGESNYEDLYDRFWEYDENADTSTFHRFTGADVRRPRYESVLSGALVGVTYGANGVYQWHTERLPEPWKFPRYTVLEALDLPGSSDMSVLRDIMVRLAWYTFTPSPWTWLGKEGSDRIATAESPHHIVSYFPQGISPREYTYAGPRFPYMAWVSPRDGARFPRIESRIDASFDKPDTCDWLFVGADNIDDLEMFPLGMEDHLTLPRGSLSVELFPSPLRGVGTIRLHAPGKDDWVTLRIVDGLGRSLYEREIPPTSDERDPRFVIIDGNGLASGAYRLHAFTRGNAVCVPFIVFE
ncbi:MAG: DUF4038 domain-containing protein [Bacteroidota bacterium]|nr:DUF4038 domain-containing protein [Bacteroidota bacterium]